MKSTTSLIISLAILAVASLYQDYVIHQQRALILEMVKNPACMVDVPISSCGIRPS